MRETELTSVQAPNPNQVYRSKDLISEYDEEVPNRVVTNKSHEDNSRVTDTKSESCRSPENDSSKGWISKIFEPIFKQIVKVITKSVKSWFERLFS